MAEICDFANSYLTFTVPDLSNTPRIQFDSRCIIYDSSGRAEEFYLITPCKSENMYLQSGLLKDPNYDFGGIWSRTEHVIIRTFALHDPGDAIQWEAKENSFYTDVEFEIRHVADVVRLHSDAEVVEATLANRRLFARTFIEDGSGAREAMLEYPVKTMNVSRPNNRFQVDTGPVLFPRFAHGGELADARPVEQFQLAFTVYNGLREAAEFVLCVPTPVEAGGESRFVSHYSQLVSTPARHEIYSA